VASAERPTFKGQRKYLSVPSEPRFAAAPRVATYPSRAELAKDLFTQEAKKCYNLELAMCGKITASCMTRPTATLLLVVDRYSQVLGAAVHQYSQLIRKPQPLPYRHDSTQTRNSARFTK
jgi:hypothetical protein